jgi:hypothetical protein
MTSAEAVGGRKNVKQNIFCFFFMKMNRLRLISIEIPKSTHPNVECMCTNIVRNENLHYLRVERMSCGQDHTEPGPFHQTHAP